MDVKLSSTLFTLFSVLTLAGCQTPSKNIALNQSTEERTFILLADIPDSDSDGVLDDIDNCPNTPKNVVVDELGCPTPVDLMDLITMDMRVFFERNSNELQSKYFPELEKVTDKMLTRPDLDLVVVLAGHISEPEALQRSISGR
ncbi:thrombospondin type 3 repeat-containing protein [Psychrobacter alimentarius]|uniref:thrombospondin type 3 repeat-containing protein n=1 Tax=Psychrobacter alimentarius TaxID=261164 RepID=UPI003FCF67EE